MESEEPKLPAVRFIAWVRRDAEDSSDADKKRLRDGMIKALNGDRIPRLSSVETVAYFDHLRRTQALYHIRVVPSKIEPVCAALADQESMGFASTGNGQYPPVLVQRWRAAEMSQAIS
jgi:hypothetical protein